MFRSNTILRRIALILSLFALIPMTFLAFNIIYNLNAAKQTSAQTIATHECEQLAESIGSLKHDIESIASVFGMDHTLINSSKQLRRGATIGQEIECYQNLREIISLIKTNEEIEEIRIYLPDSALVTRQQVNLFGLSDLNWDVLPEVMTSGKANSGWIIGENGNLFYYYHIVYSRLSDAYFSIEVDISQIESMFQSSGLRGQFALLNEYDQTIWTFSDRGGDYRQSFPVDNWTLTVDMPLYQFGDNSSMSIATWMIMLCFMLILIPVLAYLTSRSISRTIHQIAQANEALTRQQYHQIPEDSSIRELLMLQKSHNIMVMSIQQMIRDVYEAQHALDQAELNSLFEQVKPHFLYNTLESGKWLALSEHAHKTATFLETLSVFYRTGLSKGRTFIPLRQELLHIQEYVNLMNMRYSDSILLQLDVDCDADRILILRLILQPLVENAIEHGLHGEREKGLVSLKVTSDGHFIDIIVADNGAGLTPNSCDQLNLANGGGYGLSNIRQRLKIYYGDEAFLTLTPGPECGAIAHIRILHKEI